MQSSTGFRPRQSSYLRISPTQVLQLTLYLEPHHTAWMNNGVLERMLFALKDRIPLKLAQEEGNRKKSGKEKTQVDVFRGADYQMAFFFRRANDKHVVLLKDKHLHYTTKPSSTPAPPAASSSSSRKRARTASTAPGPSPSSKRRAAESKAENNDDDEGVVVVKPEPVDEELPFGEGGLFRPEREEDEKDDDEVKVEEPQGEIDEDVKPVLKVNYQGYRIFGRTLVVIVEPYPPLSPADLALARPGLLQTEIRQLSASVAPDAYRQSTAATFRGSTLSASATPGPRRRGEEPLFRRGSTVAGETPGPGAGAEGATPAPTDDGIHKEEEDDGEMAPLRRKTRLFADDLDAADEEGDGVVDFGGRGEGMGGKENEGEAGEEEELRRPEELGR
ncbi:hypothetical protein JCM8097_004425 [Rhodosporidiobolus ruineniae]